ncbi:hypothetical protein BDN71DRAFT_326930 [Pleurotus eryngii]|uniref:Uncharacterized protein n=1 Tax=Pleurotus eryngii TaxID=5323 RepID=A0A9P6DB62_PLEER|nr:hypothetical protein BDN71DRAFT_326930 [Pleurotus eryngii]
MPARITPVTERTALGRAEHVVEAGTMSASPSAPPAEKQVKRQAKSTVDGPSATKKRRISKIMKEKPSPSTRKQYIKKAREAATTVLAPEAPDPLVGIVSCEGQPATAESGDPDSLPIVDDHASTTVVVPVSAGPSNLEVPKRRPGKPKKVVDPGVLRSAGPSQRKPTKRSAKYTGNNRCQVQWKVITPPKPSEDKDRGLHDATIEYSDSFSELRPRVWASCKEDLLHVIPELSKPVNGLSWKSLETPMMLLEDQASITWGIDSHNLMTSADLSITQEYLYSAKPLPASPPHLPVDLVLEPEDEPMTFIQDIIEGLGDFFGVPDLLGGDEVLATAEEIAQSQEVFGEELPLLQCSDHSPKAQTPEISLSKAEDAPPGIRTLVKNYMPGTLSISSPAEPSSQMIANGAGLHQQGIGTSVNTLSKEDPAAARAMTKQTTSGLLSAPCPVHLKYRVIASEPAENQQQAPALPPQDMPPKEIPTPVGAMAESYMSELPLTPSPVDLKSQVIGEGSANNQPIPAGLPQDIEALVNAYIRGIPVVLVAPREKLPIVLSQDHSWVILGFYQVTAVTEESIPQETPVKGRSATRINWRFRLKWSPGGEYLLSGDTEAVSRPWWRKDSHPLQQELITTVSTEHYQKRRDEHTTAYPQFGDVGQKYNCLIPPYLLHMPGQVDGDANFPSGWFCMDCGRLNPQVYFRHRVCSSRACKDKPLERGYALELQKIRQPQDAMPFATPLQCPPLTSLHVDDSGTTTYNYSSVFTVPILIKHIFTHNRSSLQQDATRVFRDIQTDILLMQGSLGYAHFSYVVGADFLGMGVKKLYWSEASGTVTSEAERLSRLAEQRGDFRISRFSPDVTVIAWPSAGTTKQTQVLKARENAICVQCFGSSTLISLRALPTSETSAGIKEIDSTTHSEVSTRNRKNKQDDMLGSLVQASRNSPEEKEKCQREHMSVSLVHGDILVICGHDVELKVKRNHPTTVLMIVNVPLRASL